MAAADTNVLVRLLVEDDEEQEAHARAFLRTAGAVFVSHLVLVEATWVLASAYGLTRDQLARTVELVLSTDAFVVERPEVVAEALGLFRAARAGFSDCMIVAIARSANQLPVATFDEQASRLPGARRLGRKARKTRGRQVFRRSLRSR